MYDYAHPLGDSFEGITHSLCTLEFETRREIYYWYLDKLNLYKPFVWEFSRLNLTDTIISKRNLTYLVDKKYVDGWDDPRLLTIDGMRRRGYTAQSIKNFCDSLSVTRRGNENIIEFKLLKHFVRDDLNNKCKRTMAVLDPVKITITNFKQPITYEAKIYP